MIAMKYICDTDYTYIMNKYHDASKPFDNFKHLLTNHEAFYDANTGLSSEEIEKGILENDKKYQAASRSVRKARAIEYVLQNTRISCNKRDRFPGICTIHRVIDRALISQWRNEVTNTIIPEVFAKRYEYAVSGLVSVVPDYSHSAPRWDRVFRLGLRGIMAESEAAKEKFIQSKPLDFEEAGFYESIQIVYSAIIAFLYRLAEAAKDKNPRLEKALLSLAENPPQSFYEQLLLDYLFFIIMEHIACMNCRTLGNFDAQFYALYQQDLAKGVSAEALRADLAYFLMQFPALGNYWQQPVYLGGTKADGTSQINELSYELLRVYDEMGIYNPKIQIKLAKNTPKPFVLKALEMIRSGHNSIVFIMDETMQKSLMRAGATKDEARRGNITGCYESYMPEAIPMAMIYFNLIKPLEYTLSGGYDIVSGKLCGLETSTAFETFAEFYETYRKQLSHSISKTLKIVDGFAPYLWRINPQPILSATFETAIANARDALNGGCKNPSCVVMCGYLANIADSMTAIKELCFDKKELSVSEFKEILENNWEGHEQLRQRVLNRLPHYGNNEEIPDRFAAEISSYVSEFTETHNNIYGFPCGAGFHVARMHYNHGKMTFATPDGRLAGQELSKNISASMGSNTKGPTAAILSATKLAAASFQSDACLDLGIHPSSVTGADGLEAMYALLMTFEARGGHALHINVFDGETLKKAQQEPEKYKDLQIRVCGWNVLWNNISKEEQDGFIRQAEALI